MNMQKKNSGNVRSLPQPSPAQQEQNARNARVNAAQQMQSGFFTLRTQLFNTLLRNAGPLIQASDLEGLRALAHEAAKRDFISRCTEAKALLEYMGEKMDPAPLFDLLMKEDE